VAFFLYWLILIGSWEDFSEKSGHVFSSEGDEVFIHFHEESHLTQCLKHQNLLIEFRDLLQYSNTKGEMVRDLILIGRKPE
jgi:hypothetical protein